MAFPEFVHVTAQYSNAVIAAILPYVSDFAQKLDLPVPIPLTSNHVRRATALQLKDYVGAHIVFTNGFEFWFRHGVVGGFEAPDNYFAEQNIERITNYFGVARMTTNEAITMARGAFRKLGYTEKDLPFADQPEIRGMERSDEKIIPFVRLEWASSNEFPKATVDINAEKKTIIGMQLIGTNFWRASPKVDVVPELERDYQKRIKGQNSEFRENAPQRLPSLPVPRPAVDVPLPQKD